MRKNPKVDKVDIIDIFIKSTNFIRLSITALDAMANAVNHLLVFFDLIHVLADFMLKHELNQIFFIFVDYHLKMLFIPFYLIVW